MLIISPRFAYFIAGLCGLYLSVAPFFTSIRGSITWFRVGLWVGTLLLLIPAFLPSTRTTNVTALVGSTVTTLLLTYGIARFVAFRLGYIHGKAQLSMYQPNVFDRLNAIASRPILLLFLIFSVASLLISALLTFRLRNQRTPRTEP